MDPDVDPDDVDPEEDPDDVLDVPAVAEPESPPPPPPQEANDITTSAMAPVIKLLMFVPPVRIGEASYGPVTGTAPVTT